VLDVMKPRRSRGQAMVEFALVAPVFFLLVFSVIQFGIMFGGQNGLVAATRELARYAAPYHVKTSTDATSVCNDTRLGTQLTTFLKQSIPGYVSTNVEQRQVVYSWQPNPLITGQPQTYYVQLQIHVSYHFPLYVPLVGGLIDGFDPNPWKSDNRYMLDATEQMRIENEDLPATYANVTCNI
jgi:Flp pilus assembly protein TadG